MKKSLHRFFVAAYYPTYPDIQFTRCTHILSNCVYVLRSNRAHRIDRRFLTFLNCKRRRCVSVRISITFESPRSHYASIGKLKKLV